MSDRATHTDAQQANEAILNGFWVKAMESLVGQGIPWAEAAKSMLSIAALQVEAALGTEVAEKSLDAARAYMAQKRDGVVQHQQNPSSARH